MKNEILSTVDTAPGESLIYSSLSVYGERRGGELPGTWFVRALGDLGRSATSVRQALYRLERNGELETRKVGRTKLYRLSRVGRAGVGAGTAMIFDPPEEEWDGLWTVVHYQFSGGDRRRRDHLRFMLDLEGFAAFDRGLYLHPRDRSSRLLEALADEGGADEVTIFRAERLFGETNRKLVRRLWDLEELEASYKSFLDLYRPLTRRKAESWKPREAFVTRFALVLDYLATAWRDPELPRQLLPARWSGHRAREITRRLYETLLPGTLTHSDEFLELPTPTTKGRP